MAVLPIVTVSFLILLNSQLFQGDLRTVHNQRFLGSLCVIPYLHLLFTFLIYRKPKPLRVVATVLQTALFVYVLYARSSAFWMIFSFVVIVGLNGLIQFGRPREDKTGPTARQLIFSWPLILLFCGFSSAFVYKSATISPIYGFGVFLPYHMIWHNAYMGLAVEP